MRPIANFTFHAILAAALAALAASSAAADPARLVSGEVFVKLPGAAGSGDGHIEITSYSFGASRVSKVEGFTVKQGTARHRSDASAGKGANEMRMEDSAGVEKMQPGGGSASGAGVNRVFVKSWSTSGDASSTQATGKRMHKPLRMRMIYNEGSVTLSGRFPGCRVGASYPAVAVGHGDELYEIQDATVADCSPGGMNLNFKKVTVRGWNPETKEL
jgi:hypothetical protein